MAGDTKEPDVIYPGLLELSHAYTGIRQSLIPIMSYRYAPDLEEAHKDSLDKLIASMTTRLIMELSVANHSFKGEDNVSRSIH